MVNSLVLLGTDLRVLSLFRVIVLGDAIVKQLNDCRHAFIIITYDFTIDSLSSLINIATNLRYTADAVPRFVISGIEGINNMRYPSVSIVILLP